MIERILKKKNTVERRSKCRIGFSDKLQLSFCLTDSGRTLRLSDQDNSHVSFSFFTFFLLIACVWSVYRGLRHFSFDSLPQRTSYLHNTNRTSLMLRLSTYYNALWSSKHISDHKKCNRRKEKKNLTSWAWAGVATFPVPMAQTGS